MVETERKIMDTVTSRPGPVQMESMKMETCHMAEHYRERDCNILSQLYHVCINPAFGCYTT